MSVYADYVLFHVETWKPNPPTMSINVITLNYDAPKVLVRVGGGRILLNHATRHVRVVTNTRAVSVDVELLD